MSQKKPIRDLYLANSIKNLDILAGKYNSSKLSNRIDKLCDFADKVYFLSKEDPSDQEKTYVYLVRYLKLIDEIRKQTEDDEIFVNSRFGHKLRWCKDQWSLIRTNLMNRYKDMNSKEDLTVSKYNNGSVDNVPQEVESVEQPGKLFAAEPFALCQEVFNLHNNNKYKLLIIDIRSEIEYDKSHIKDIDNLNVPDSFIKTGLSANLLEGSLPQTNQNHFKNRALYDVIILMDWSTTAQKYPLSKLQILHDILTKWEIKITYKFNPFILDGGYLAWIEKYPTLSTNSHIIYNREYSDLDELLDLDNIQYPTDITNTSIVKILEEPKPEPVVSPTPTRDTLLSKLQEIALKQLQNERDLLKTQKRLMEINNLLRDTTKPERNARFQIQKIELENEMSKLESLKIQVDERKTKLTKEFSLNASFEPGGDHNLKQKMNEIELLEQDIVKTYKQRKALSLIIKDITPEKPIYPESSTTKITKPATPESSPVKPFIDRKRKPTTMNYLPGTIQTVSNGLTGLENIRNTCYMNTLVQCMRHLPSVMSYFCTGDYSLAIKDKDVQITLEFAELFRCLWSNSHTVIRPTKFYNRLCNIEPMYAEGQHECVHMFFLFLLDNLHEDSGIHVDNKNDSSKSTAWLIQFKGKFSFFLKQFYHQIQETQLCGKCGKKAVRFQSEPTLMLAVPKSQNFTIEELLEYYFTQDCKYCTKCNVECKVHKVLSYCPPIITIVLKRYHQNGSKFQRNNFACHFKTDNLVIGSQRYKLHAIAMHQGTLESGHYTAACLNPKDNKWYEFNDSVVRLMDINDSKVKVKAYVLFYVAISPHLSQF